MREALTQRVQPIRPGGADVRGRGVRVSSHQNPGPCEATAPGSPPILDDFRVGKKAINFFFFLKDEGDQDANPPRMGGMSLYLPARALLPSGLREERNLVHTHM